MSYQKGEELLVAALGKDRASQKAKKLSRRNLNRPLAEGVDKAMFRVIIDRLRARDARVAQEVERAYYDDRITNNFCDESQLYEQVERFNKQESFAESQRHNVNYRAAWEIFRMMCPVPKKKLDPILLTEETDILTLISNPDASSGYIAYPDHKKDCLEIIRKMALAIVKDYDLKLSFPAVALTRAQISDYTDENDNLTPENIKYKTRLVMCVDAATTTVEAQFSFPFMDYMKNSRQYAGGSNDADLMRFLLMTCEHKYWLSLDYSKFDASIQVWEIDEIFDYFAEFFDDEYRPAFEWMKKQFTYLDLIMPDGSVVRILKGVKSGDGWTQTLGTIANHIRILTGLCNQFGHKDGNLSRVNIQDVINQLLPRNSKRLSDLTICAMGDDSIVFTNTPIDAKSLSTYLWKMFKAKITLEGEKGFKSGQPGDAPQFLKRKWFLQGQVRPEVEMWVHLLHPERYRTYKNYSPYHILYGYYLTFKGTMRKYFTEEELVHGMEESTFGIDALAQMSIYDMPGSLRFQLLSRGINREDLVRDLKRRYLK